jgi:hypothetical protein
MIKAKDEWNVLLGGPGSILDDYSLNFLNSFFRCKMRKDKIKRLFNEDRREK